MHELTIIWHWADSHKTDLLALVGGAGGLSVVLESVLLRLKNKWHVDSKKLSFTLLHLFTVVTTAVTWYLSNMRNYDVLPVYASLAIFAEVWHRFVVSGFFTRVVVPFLTYLSQQKPTAPAVATPPVPAASPADPDSFV